MSRERKFRVWNDKTKTMFHFWRQCKPEGQGVIAWETRDCYHEEWDESDWEDMEVMDYTGLKDKEDKQSYEDDICNYEYWVQTSPDPDSLGKTFKGIGVIRFIEGCFMIKDNSTNPIPLHYSDLSFEIIGNTYQNPNLLK